MSTFPFFCLPTAPGCAIDDKRRVRCVAGFGQLHVKRRCINGPHNATLEEHTHHKARSTGSQCIACHMPKIEKTTADVKVHAHTFQLHHTNRH